MRAKPDAGWPGGDGREWDETTVATGTRHATLVRLCEGNRPPMARARWAARASPAPQRGNPIGCRRIAPAVPPQAHAARNNLIDRRDTAAGLRPGGFGGGFRLRSRAAEYDMDSEQRPMDGDRLA